MYDVSTLTFQIHISYSRKAQDHGTWRTVVHVVRIS